MKILFIVIISCFSFFNATGNETKKQTNARFIHLQQSEGLIQNSVTAIKQDLYGFMWIGTPNGLYKYDGYKFDAFKHQEADPKTIISNSIRTIFEDTEGKIWIGTDKGLSIYDYNTDSFLSPTNLINISINTIAESSDKHFWVGSNNGLYHYHQSNSELELQKIITKNPEISLNKGISGNAVSCLHFDNDSNLWIGTNNGINLLLFDDLTNNHKDNDYVFEHLNDYSAYTRIHNTPISEIASSENGEVFIGTLNGLFTIEGNLCRKIALSDTDNDEYIIKSLLYNDNERKLWIGTKNNGLVEFDFITKRKVTHKNSPINPYSIASDQINDVYLDSNNLLWIGCARGGISKLYLKQKSFEHYFNIPLVSNSLSNNQINAICEDLSSNVWIATYSKGVDYLTFNDGEPDYIHLSDKLKELKNWQIFSLLVDHNGNLWMGTHGDGLILVPKNELDKLHKGFTPDIIKFNSFIEGEIKQPLKSISNIIQINANEFWLSSFVGEGITKMTLKTGNDKSPEFERFLHDPFEQASICSNNISTLFKDDKGIIWAGSRDNGITVIETNSRQQSENYLHIKTDASRFTSLSSDRIFAINQDNEGRIWIGTFGGGINILKQSSSLSQPEFIHINETNGLADNSIYGMLKDQDGNFWVSTDVGISKINASTLEVRNFNVSDGIQKGNFRRNAVHKGYSGQFYFGGISGVTAFKPDYIQKDTTPPHIFITNFSIQDKNIRPNKLSNNRMVLTQSIQTTDKLKISPSERSFSIELASTQYAHPDHNIFYYCLEGLTKEWQEIEPGTNKVTFSNLKHGTYLFKAKTISPDGIESQQLPGLTIEILPPLYLTNYAIAFYIITIILIFWGFRRIIIFRQQLSNELKIEQIEKEKIREINKMKLTFFTNISHEFKTPLTLILGPLDNILSSGKLDRYVIDNLKIMQSNAKRMLKLVEQLMEFRKIETGHLKLNLIKADVVFFLREITNAFMPLAKKQQVELNFNSSTKYLPLEFDADMLEKVIYNILSNAIKHTPENGAISIEISKEKHHRPNTNTNSFFIVDNDLDQCISIVIKDTGKGIPEDEIVKIFDRFYKAENSESNIQSSTGIGLSMVKSLIELHKGILIVSSKPDIGSTFTIKLPALSAIEEKKAAENLLLQAPNHFLDETLDPEYSKPMDLPVFFSDFSSGKRPLMLIVDDNAEIRQFLCQAFEKYFEIQQAPNGKEALEMAISNLPEIIISDVMMPEMDGFELTHAIKENTLTNHIPIILLTAKGTLEHRIEGIKKGADSYIPKPFKLEHLAARIQQLMDLRKALREKYLSESALKPTSKTLSYSSAEMTFLQNAEKAIENNLSNTEFAVADLESELSLSRMQLYRKLKSLVDLSANEFIRDYRLRRAAIMLSEGDLNISEIIDKTGFSNHSYFTRCFKKKYGKSPKEFAKDYK